MIDCEDISELEEFKLLLNLEIANCMEAIAQHKKFVEVKLIYGRINELEAVIDVLLQNSLS
jgi:hypothetical protein